MRMRDGGGLRVLVLVLLSAAGGTGPLERSLPGSELSRADARMRGCLRGVSPIRCFQDGAPSWQQRRGGNGLSASTSQALSLRGGDAGEDTEMSGAVVAQEGGEGASVAAKGKRVEKAAEPARVMPARGAKKGTIMADDDPQVRGMEKPFPRVALPPQRRGSPVEAWPSRTLEHRRATTIQTSRGDEVRGEARMLRCRRRRRRRKAAARRRAPSGSVGCAWR